MDYHRLWAVRRATPTPVVDSNSPTQQFAAHRRGRRQRKRKFYVDSSDRKRLPFDPDARVSRSGGATVADDNLGAAEYKKASKYRNKPTEPSFRGYEPNFLSFAALVMAYLRLRGIPNFFPEYLTTRKVPPRFSKERKIADGEIFDLLTSWLQGTAKTFIITNLDKRSGHMVWCDMVDKFLSQSNLHKVSLLAQLNDIRHDPSKESIPQFFKRFNELVVKHRLMKCATCDNSDLKYTAMLKAARHTDNFIDWSIVERAESIFDLEQKLLEREQVDWLFSQANGRARVEFKSNSPGLEFGGDNSAAASLEGGGCALTIEAQRQQRQR